MQLSTVCRTFAAAAAEVPLDLYFVEASNTPPCGRAPACLSSHLLRSWAATSLSSLDADLDLCLDTGLFDMVAAASDLDCLVLRGDSAAACQLASRLVAAGPRVKMLECRGAVVPRSLPQGLNGLFIAERMTLQGGQTQLQDLMLQVSQQETLLQLGLSLGSLPNLSALACISRSLILQITLLVDDSSPILLDQLRQHLCSNLCIGMVTDIFCQHQAIIASLQQLRTNAVIILMAQPFTEPLQRLWSRLYFGNQGLSFVLRARSPALQVLPLAGRGPSGPLRICLRFCNDQEIAWAAMRGRSVLIVLDVLAHLYVQGCPESIADSQNGPTELRIEMAAPDQGYAPLQVHGLPDSCLNSQIGVVLVHITTSAGVAVAA